MGCARRSGGVRQHTMAATTRLRARALILAVVGGFTLAACGDDDDDGSEDSTPPSGEATTASVGGATTSVSSAATTTASTTPSTGGTTSGTSTTAGPSVELVDAGAEGDRIRLPGTPEVGQSAASSVTMDINLAMEGPGVSEEVPFVMRIDTEPEIVEVTDSGYVVETTITRAELTEGPPDLDAASFGQIEGVTYRQERSADGGTGEAELVDADQATDVQRQAFNQFIGQLKATPSIAYPSEPVGVGARWRATQPVQNQGLAFEITYEYELTSMEGDSYRIDVTYDQPIDEEISQGGQTGRMRGTVSGGGRSSGSVTNPLLVTTQMRQDFDVDIEAGGQQLAMTMDVRVDLESTAG
jgi:Family of unknown function (DUF6263)